MLHNDYNNWQSGAAYSEERPTDPARDWFTPVFCSELMAGRVLSFSPQARIPSNDVRCGPG